MVQSRIAAYLSRHAEGLASTTLPSLRPVRHVVCIPVCDEDQGFLETLKSLAEVDGAGDALLMVLVNGAEDAPAQIHERNGQFLKWFRDVIGAQAAPLALGTWEGMQVLVVDRASTGQRLPAKQGVGLARKILGDLALALHTHGTIASPWMACTDADVRLPRDYLRSLPDDDAPFSAALYPFVHVPEGPPAQQRAMKQYECFLHYVVLGMGWAGSPYAYHSVGSSFAVHMGRYAAVRGFPRRMAAEDFYMLNKLVKQAPLLTLCGQPIRIRGRESARVPFGTGRAVRDIQAETQPYQVYDPRVFTALGLWTSTQAAFASRPREFPWSSALAHPSLPPGLLERCLRAQGALQAAEKAAGQARAGDPLRRRLFEWNDALRSLRLLHMLRDGGLPSMPLQEALCAAPFIDGALASRGLEGVWQGMIETAAAAPARSLGCRPLDASP